MMLLRFANGRFGQVASVGYRDGATTYGADLICERGTLHIADRSVELDRAC